MKVIFDTMIWYGLGNGSITLSETILPIYVTYINIDELARTPNLLTNITEVRNAIKSAMTLARDKIIDNPYIYLLKMDNPSFKANIEHDKNILKITKELANGATLTNEYIEECKNDWILPRKRELEEIAEEYNQLFDNIKTHIEGNITKTEVRKSDITPFIKEFIRNEIANWTEEHLNQKITLSDNFDWSKVEFYVNVWASWYVELILSKMKVQPHDFYDISNLVYVQPNDKYWTKETRWVNIIKNIAKQGHYLMQ